MTSEQCIDIIKNRLIALVNSGQLKAKIKPSKSSISFYVNDIDVGERPLLTLRLSDHNPTYQNYIHSDLTPPSEGYNANVSIEFYKPKYRVSDGRRVRNRVNAGVKVPQDVKGIVPFFVNSYEYEPSLLVAADIDQIYNAILSWINGGYNAEYIDPFANTPKGAKVKSKIANITWNIAQNITVDNNGNYGSPNGWGADYVSESNNNRINSSKNMNKKPIQLTESDLHNIVENVVSNMLNGMGIGQQQQGQQTQQTQSQQQRQQQPQQQQGQQQNNNNQALTEARFLQWNQAFQQYLKNFNQQIINMNKKLDYIMNGGISRYGNNGGFKGLNNM